jgi:hypothetical protein
VNVDEIVFAHEYVDAGGDFFQKSLAAQERKRFVKVLVSGYQPIEIEGHVRAGAYDRNFFNVRYFVMETPKFAGIPEPELEPREKSPYAELDYVLVAKDKLLCVLDFAPAKSVSGNGATR